MIPPFSLHLVKTKNSFYKVCVRGYADDQLRGELRTMPYRYVEVTGQRGKGFSTREAAHTFQEALAADPPRLLAEYQRAAGMGGARIPYARLVTKVMNLVEMTGSAVRSPKLPQRRLNTRKKPPA